MAENQSLPEQLDLTQILATLARLPQQNISTVAQSNPQQQAYDPSQPPLQPTQSLDPTKITQESQPVTQNQSRDPRLAGRTETPHRHQAAPQRPQKTSSTPTVDPTSITEWKHGLRCVSKIPERNPAFGTAIKKLIKDQKRNYRDWENGRNRFIKEQKIKRDNEKTLRSAVYDTGILKDAPAMRTSQREKEELDAFHLKVYRACTRMSNAHSEELKRLGVPFFGLRPEFLLADGEVGEVGEGEGEGQPKINNKQLLELKRKMVGHLWELYEDEE